MFPISHSDDSVDLANLDGTDVLERRDESQTGNQELYHCSNEKRDGITSRPSDKTADKTVTTDNKSATRRQASAPVSYTHLTLPTNREV